MPITYRVGNDLDLDQVQELYRGSTLGERRPVEDLDEAGAGAGDGAEATGGIDDGPEVPTDRVGLVHVPFGDAHQLGHQRVGLVPLVPHEGEAAAGPQHPVDLRQGLLVGEPVEGLGADDGVHGAVGQRDGLGGPVQGPGPGQGRDQLLSHLGHRFHRDHLRPGRGQQSGELAGARAQIDADPAGPQPELARQPPQQVGGIPWPPAGIGLRGG